MRRLLLYLLLGAVWLPAADVVLDGATVYPSPETPPLPDARVVIHDGRIAAVGTRSATRAPSQARIIDCAGKFIVAGFWNCHVHLLAPGLLHADAPAAALNPLLDDMFNRRGFTHVFDLASTLANTLVLRDRIERGELRGPRVLTVGEPLWTDTPIYIRDFLAVHRLAMPEVKNPADAVQRVIQLAARGADGVKLFSGSIQGRGVVTNMPLALAAAASGAAHDRRLPVFAHPQNAAGLEVVIASGGDVLAHTIPQMPPWTPDLVARLKAARIALIPTLSLFDYEARKEKLPVTATEAWLDLMVGQLRVFAAGGGEVLFGTDIGYTDHYDTTLEFTLMARAGPSFPQLLASLTTAPAARFGGGQATGRIAAGSPADLVVLDSNPARDSAALAQVHLTLRRGEIMYSAPK